MTLATPVTVYDVPHIDTPKPYRPIDLGDGMPWIVLPSGHHAINLTCYDDVRTILMDSTSSRTECNVDGGPSFWPTLWAPEVLINLDNPVHSAARKFIAADFSAQGVAALGALVSDASNAALHGLHHSAAPDLMHDVFDVVPSNVVCRLLGLPLQRREFIHDNGRIIQLADADAVDGIVSAWNALYDYLGQAVSGDTPCTTDGLIRRYAARAKANSTVVDTRLVQGIVMGIVLGGDNNITTMLAKSMVVALAQPQIWHRLVAEPDTVSPFIEEVLRLMPLGTPGTFPRLLTRELSTSIGVLAAGTVVYPNVSAANRDPAVFADPTVIDIDRVGPRHLQFGHGMHHCMGAAMTRLVMGHVIGRLIDEFPALRLTVEPADVPWWFGIGLRRPKSLPVAW